MSPQFFRGFLTGMATLFLMILFAVIVSRCAEWPPSKAHTGALMAPGTRLPEVPCVRITRQYFSSVDSFHGVG